MTKSLHPQESRSADLALWLALRGLNEVCGAGLLRLEGTMPSQLTQVEVLALTLVEGRKRGLARPGFQRFARKHPAFRQSLKGVIRAVVNDDGSLNKALDRAILTAVRAATAGHRPKGGRQ